MTKEVLEVLRYCPNEILRAVQTLPGSCQAGMEELRLRLGAQPMYRLYGEEHTLSAQSVNKACLEEILSRATGQALYASHEMLKNGFLTLTGGHRIGVCGTAVYKNGELFTFQDISSLNLRIARQILGVACTCADFLWTHPRSTLIIAPPGRGKTTLLRDLIRQLSERFGWNVCVVDERKELAACKEGTPQFDLGTHSDVLSGARKEEAIKILLRTMNPQWIALDEITAAEDVEAMIRASYCGVRFLATAHAADIGELKKRPIYQMLLRAQIFENLGIIGPNREIRMERMTNIA